VLVDLQAQRRREIVTSVEVQGEVGRQLRLLASSTARPRRVVLEVLEAENRTIPRLCPSADDDSTASLSSSSSMVTDNTL